MVCCFYNFSIVTWLPSISCTTTPQAKNHLPPSSQKSFAKKNPSSQKSEQAPQLTNFLQAIFEIARKAKKGQPWLPIGLLVSVSSSSSIG
jgi:hypothetical protein